jgi:hypothetical protein
MANEGASGSWRELSELLGAPESFRQLQKKSGSFKEL